MKYLKLFEDMNKIDWTEDWEEEDDDDPYKNYPKDFKKFLIKHDALENFHENFLNRDDRFKYDRPGDLKKYLHGNKYDWINYAFNWEKSPQKREYWGNLYNKWNKN